MTKSSRERLIPKTRSMCSLRLTCSRCPVSCRSLSLLSSVYDSHPRLTSLTLRLSVIDAGNAVPLYLGATAHGAKQLAALCEYWMATDLARSKNNEQWCELSEEVRARVAVEHKRLQEARAAQSEKRKLLEKLPCLRCAVRGCCKSIDTASPTWFARAPT